MLESLEILPWATILGWAGCALTIGLWLWDRLTLTGRLKRLLKSNESLESQTRALIVQNDSLIVQNDVQSAELTRLRELVEWPLMGADISIDSQTDGRHVAFPSDMLQSGMSLGSEATENDPDKPDENA